MMMLTPIIQKSLADKLLDINKNWIQFVGIIDTEKKTFVSKHQKNEHSILETDDEIKFVHEIIEMTNMFESSNLFGNVMSLHIQREKGYCLFFIFSNLVVSIVCNPIIGNTEVSIISENVEFMMKNMIISSDEI